MGSDSYFRVKKSIAQGSFVRAKVHHNILEELQLEGKTVYRPEEGGMLGIDAAAYLLILTAFFFFAALVLAAAVAMRRDRRRRRKNKK